MPCNFLSRALEINQGACEELGEVHLSRWMFPGYQQKSGSAGKLPARQRRGQECLHPLQRQAWAELALGAVTARAGEQRLPRRRRWHPVAAALWGLCLLVCFFHLFSPQLKVRGALRSGRALVWGSTWTWMLPGGHADAAGGSGTPLSPALQTLRPRRRPRTRPHQHLPDPPSHRSPTSC